MKQPSEVQVGVLALQGDFQAHAAMLMQLGVEPREVRRPHQLEGLHGLVMPGGESTTMWTFLDQLDMGVALQRFAANGGALYGTCAGVILLAQEIHNPQRPGLGILDISVERNGYGRQMDSNIHEVRDPATGAETLEIVLIRAPRILRTGNDVSIRLTWKDDPLWVEQGRVMGTTFHPELGKDLRFHARFLELARAARDAAPEMSRAR